MADRVNTKLDVREQVYSSQPKTYTSTGKGGVDVGNLWNRLLYAAKFADVNILLSDRVHPQSKRSRPSPADEVIDKIKRKTP